MFSKLKKINKGVRRLLLLLSIPLLIFVGHSIYQDLFPSAGPDWERIGNSFGDGNILILLLTIMIIFMCLLILWMTVRLIIWVIDGFNE